MTYQREQDAESGIQLAPVPETMHRPRVEFLHKMPAEVLDSVQNLVNEWSWLTPPWCQDLYIGWDAAGRDDQRAMDCQISYAYRRITIRIYSAFLDEAPQKRQQFFIHELLHGFVGVMAEFVESAIDRLVPDNDAPKFRETLRAELDQRHESVVQDLAYRIEQRMAARAE